jgi:DNA helicase HerA-like ATPase
MDLVIGEREMLTHVSAEWQPFGLSIEDRRRHLYVIGKTGTGKSTLLPNLIVQEIEAGRGLMLLDPHGELVEEVLDYIPPRRVADVIYVSPADLSHPVGFNLLERVPRDDRPLVGLASEKWRVPREQRGTR